MKRITFVVSLSAILFAMAGCPPEETGTQYVVQTLPFDSIDPETSSLDPFGEVAGMARNNEDELLPAVWSDDTLYFLAGAEGFVDSASAIAPTGAIIGLARPDDGPEDELAITYWIYGVRTMRNQTPAERRVFAANSQLQTVGSTKDEAGQEFPMLWSLTGEFDLPTYDDLGGRAQDINSRGQIVGYSRTTVSGDNTTAVVWNVSGLAAIGGIGGRHSSANAINDLGLVVGHGGTSSTDDSVYRAWYAQDTGPVALPTLGGARSLARDVNNLGQIAGWSENGAGQMRAVLWERPAEGGAYEVIDLQESILEGSSVPNMTDAIDINDDGQILTLVQQGEHSSYILLIPSE